MEEILDLNKEFNVPLFEKVVATALSSQAEAKASAEAILLRFKELPGAWTKIDTILKNAHRSQSKFIALQILEENVRSKWALFSEDMKVGLRQYVFTTVIERAAGDPDIILQKFNSILIEIAKRDWPQKWSTFIQDLITVSQSTSMKVAQNTLKILENMNEQVFTAEKDVTTTRRRLLRTTLQQEYITIFRFISLILEYSKTQELDEPLLENCLGAFRSFCKSMPLEFVCETEIVEHILCHLNSPHSTSALDCLLEIVELEKGEFTEMPDHGPLTQPTDFRQTLSSGSTVSFRKIVLIYDELLAFFKVYLGKFEASEKLCTSYWQMEDAEKVFIKKQARIFGSLFALWINDLDEEKVHIGLGYFVEISKIDDPALFRIVFPTWTKIVYEMYAEYPLRVKTSQPIRRKRFSGILQAMLPVFVQNMPKPEEVFILVNDLGEVVKDRKIETAEIEFYKKMKSNLFYLSFLIEDYLKSYFLKHFEKHINQRQGNVDLNVAYRELNQLSWAMGALAGAFNEHEERDFFVSSINTLLSICEVRVPKEEKAIVASNIMFAIGQYHRFLKFNLEFLFVVIRKLFEFMDETYEGIKEMACDNFFKICERCPNQFYMRRDSRYIIEVIISDLGIVVSRLEFYLQRVVLEGLLSVLKNGPKKDIGHLKAIYDALVNQSILTPPYIDGIHAVILEHSQLMLAVHVIESYALGFKYVSQLMTAITTMDPFLHLYAKLTEKDGRNAQIVKTSIAGLFEAIVDSKYNDSDFINKLCGCVLMDFKTSLSPSLLSLATALVKNGALSSTADASAIQRTQFFISNLIAPAIPYVLKADDYTELSMAFLKLINTLVDNAFNIFMPLVMDAPCFESMMNAIFFSLTSLHEISSLALQSLIGLYRACLEQHVSPFFTHFYLGTLENLLGLVFDRDMKNTYTLQVELLFLLISSINRIPLLNSAGGSNTVIVKAFVSDLFTKNFKNLTGNSINLFIEGLIEIREVGLFKEHIDDFNVKIYEFGTDEDLAAELELLKERVAKSNN